MLPPQKKSYNGYKSFQYLEPGVDYKVFKLAKELGRVAPFVYAVTEAEEKRVHAILAKDTIVSLHDHTSIFPEDLSQVFEYARCGREWTGYEGLSISGIDLVFENYMDGTAMITSQNGWKWTDVIHDLGQRFCDFAHQDMLYKVETIADLGRAKPEGKIGVVSVIESATMIENELDRLDIMYGFGVRCMGITYSEANSLGCGLKEANDGGLTEFGKQCVRRMNRLGITIDTSHCGDKTGADAIELSERPTFITHAGARALFDSNRLKPDWVIKLCAQRGGVIGIEAAPHTTLTAKHPLHNLESYMEHFEYIANLVGIDHVAFGPDTLFGDHVALHHAFAAALSIGATRKRVTVTEVPYVEGLENPAEVFPNVVRWLVKRGYKNEDITKVVGGNVLRVLKESWAI